MTLISIHSLRVEGDTFSNFLILIQLRFQSTPSVWRETMSSTLSDTKTIVFQSTPSVWRETALACYYALWMLFQSTPSVWRETYIFFFIELKKSISIHSLRVEGDRSFHNFGFRSKKFQSTPSVWRETFQSSESSNLDCDFNPLPPCGGRRAYWYSYAVTPEISIHSLRVEGDPHGTTPQL